MISVSSIMTVILVGGFVLFKGNVSGYEFAPSHFQTREFSFYEIPYLEIQISPIRRSVVNDKLARQLRTQSLVTIPRGRKPNTWHLVSLRRGPTLTPALASLLVDSMRIGGLSGNLYWVSWISDHPNRAAVLWPTVQQLAERELYVLIPELLELARSFPGDDDAASFQTAADELLVGQYVSLIADLRLADRAPLAEELLREALQDYPDAERLRLINMQSAKSDVAAEEKTSPNKIPPSGS